MESIINNLYKMFKSPINKEYSTDDSVWLNWLVTKFRGYVQPYLYNTFDANLILIHSVAGCNTISKLYLGSFTAALCPEELKSREITHILSLVNVNPTFPDDFTYKTLPLRDSCNENLFRHLDEGAKFINQTLSQGHNILVHCFFGRSRSASIVIAYMIKYLKYSYQNSLKAIQNIRPIVQPNLNFEYQLQFLESSNENLFKSWLIILKDNDQILPACQICNMPLIHNNSVFYNNKIYHRSCLNPKIGLQALEYTPPTQSSSSFEPREEEDFIDNMVFESKQLKNPHYNIYDLYHNIC